MNTFTSLGMDHSLADPINLYGTDPVDLVSVDATVPLNPPFAPAADNDPAAVQPLPADGMNPSVTTIGAEPVSPSTTATASDSNTAGASGLTAMPQTTAATTSTVVEASQNAFYSDHQWNLLVDLGLTKYVVDDMMIGPTIGTNSATHDIAVVAKDKMIDDYYKYAITHQHVDLISKGIWQWDGSTNEINVQDMSEWSLERTKPNVWHTKYSVYGAFDASDATEAVTFNGLTWNKWYSAYGNAWGNGAGGTLGDRVGSNGHHLNHAYGNVFKGGDYGNTVYGGQYADTLIGGQGDDEIHGVDGDNVLYGVGGNNLIYGGDGNSTIFGGSGDDFIRTGAGDNSVVLANGNNWVVAEQNELDGSSYSNTLISGSGTDTFVIGNIPPAQTTTTSTMDEWAVGLTGSVGIDFGKDLFGFGLDTIGVVNPLWGMMADAAGDLLSALFGGIPSTVVETTEYPVFSATTINNFNPLSDRLLFPASGDDVNLSFRVDKNGYDLTVYDYNTNDVVCYINFASNEEIFGTTGSLTSAEKTAFAQSLLSSTLVVGGNGITIGAGYETDNFSISANDLETVNNLSEELGSGTYVFAGAWDGNGCLGDQVNEYIFGTDHGDILGAFDINGDSINASYGGGMHFYGFSGNNYYFGGTTGHDLFFGGDDEAYSDTVSYQYAEAAIHVDMTDKSLDSNNKSHGLKYTVDVQLTADDYDYLWNVENIAGTAYDDEIIGDENGNTFYSTGGANTWTGTGGSNVFHLNGGSVNIKDFSAQSDTIVLHKLAYVESSVNYQGNLKWVESEEQWTLYDQKNDDSVLVTLDKSGGFDDAPEVTLIMNNGGEKVFTPKVVAFDAFNYDLVA